MLNLLSNESDRRMEGISMKGLCESGRKRLAALLAVVLICTMGVVVPSTAAEAAQIVVDGDVKEWNQIRKMKSTDSNVSQWAVVQDEDRLYFYVQQNGGNAWSMPIAATYMSIDYASGRTDAASQIRPVLDGNMDITFRNAAYGDIADTQSAYVPSQEADKYEIEFSIPKAFFPEDTYTIHYCGDAIKSGEIADIGDFEEEQEKEAVYNGIKIDGTFSDWNAVQKTDVDREAMTQIAAVFDGDYLYIYMKENSDGAITWSGVKGNGKFTIYTDTGRNMTFKLNTDSVEGIKGASVAHSNYQYEIAIPASAVKQYKNSISFGYYMEESMLLENITNIQDQEEGSSKKEFSGIQYDGVYTDWDYYPHDLIQYSTPGGTGGDAEGALYVDGTTLYGHVLSLLHKDEKEFQPFSIRVNKKEEWTLNVRLVAVDSKGNIDMNPKLIKLDAGEYEFYLWDLNSGSTASNINDPEAPIYGRMILTVRKTADGTPISDEMEFEVDLEKLAAHFDMDASDMKLLQAQYINIGTEWLSIAGTSTGAVMGISLCGLVVLAAFLYKRKKKVA